MTKVYCERGYRGECCCNCKYQVKVMMHPTNRGFAEGDCDTPLGWACTVDFSDGSNKGEIIFLDHLHGCCELYESKETGE